ncbi:MAG TPA: substrate-binding domain-containing protein [Terriglobales bacterium]|nr:substrate-binding domain-containing protein [Terriglobales bacterium]
MKKLRFIVSLPTKDNDYQEEQARAAEQAAHRFGVEIEIVSANNDAISQTQQLLKIIQSPQESRPDAIIVEPAGGTALPQVARAAASSAIGWVVVNRDADYLAEFRASYKVPCFSITSDHEEIGRIQGKQFAALLPAGGCVLYIQGPAESLAAKQRSAGMYETKPAHVQIKVMKAQWTEESSFKAVSSWLRLSTSQQARIDAIGAQDDSMAMGARRAFQELTTGEAREHWLRLPFTGCDGVPKTGQAWVRNGQLAATIVIPPNTGLAIEKLVGFFQGGVLPPDRSLTPATSYPSIESLTKRKVRSHSA